MHILYVFILIRIFIIKCISTNVSARYDHDKNVLELIFLMSSLLLFDIVKGGEIWIAQAKERILDYQHIKRIMASTQGERAYG